MVKPGGRGDEFDVVVVGARCAGSPTAMLLATRGYKTLLLEKHSLSRDVVPGHYVHPPGVETLARWGLLDEVVQGCPPITRVTAAVASGRFTVDYGAGCIEVGTRRIPLPPDRAHAWPAYAPRRTVLDPALCHAAAQAGAMFHDRSQVVALIFEDGRVRGVRVRSPGLGHEEVQIRARIVIGADGVHSVVAKQVAAPEYDVVTSRTCSYRSYWSGVECGGLEYFRQGEQSILLMPTHGGLTWISVGSPIERLGELRRDVERGYLDAIHSVPELRDRIEEGAREERIVGMAVPRTFRRRPYGPGWALVGDAGYHRDPSGGQGITDAFRDAELVARAADDTLSGGADEGSAFAEYERTRNAFSASGYALSDLMARGGDRSSDPAKLFAAFGPARPADGPPPLPERAPTIAPSAVFQD